MVRIGSFKKGVLAQRCLYAGSAWDKVLVFKLYLGMEHSR